MSKTEESRKRRAMFKGRTERQKLELKAHFALSDLSGYFKSKDDPLQYEVNRVWWKLNHLYSIPDFPRAEVE